MESYDFINGLLAGSLRNLSHTYRYDTLRQIKPECVAEHSFYASAYTLVLYHKLIDLYPEMAEQFDLSQLLAKAICHDMEERLTGDITRCVKNILPGEIDGKAAEISRQTFIEESMPPILAYYQETALTPDTYEGRLIKLADLLCVVAKLLEEAELGNQYANKRLQARMQPQLDGMIAELEKAGAATSADKTKVPHPDADPFDLFAYRVLENTRSTLALRLICPPKAKPLHTGY